MSDHAGNEGTIKFGNLVITLHGEPGSAGCYATSTGHDMEVDLAQAAAEDTLTSVVMALHSAGALTPQVREALHSAHDAIFNHLDQLGGRPGITFPGDDRPRVL